MDSIVGRIFVAETAEVRNESVVIIGNFDDVSGIVGN